MWRPQVDGAGGWEVFQGAVTTSPLDVRVGRGTFSFWDWGKKKKWTGAKYMDSSLMCTYHDSPPTLSVSMSKADQKNNGDEVATHKVVSFVLWFCIYTNPLGVKFGPNRSNIETTTLLVPSRSENITSRKCAQTKIRQTRKRNTCIVSVAPD